MSATRALEPALVRRRFPAARSARCALLIGAALLALPAPPLGATDLVVSAIQVTQSVQRSNGRVPAIDRRATTVRAYIGVSQGIPVPGVQARLEVYLGATLLHDMLSDNGPIEAPAAPSADQEDDTLNFTFVPDPASTAPLGRMLTFVVTVDPFDAIAEDDETNNELETEKLFECRNAPTILGVPIDYLWFFESDPSTLGTPDPNLIAQGVGDAFVWGAYPFPEFTPGAGASYRLSTGAPLAWGLDVDVFGATLLVLLDLYRVGTSPVPDYVFGWFRGNPFSGNGFAFVPGTTAFGNTDTTRHQRTFAHEIGHSFGFSHNEFGTFTDQVGWDCLDRLGLGPVKPTSLFDVMVGGRLTDEAWLHSDNYETVHASVTTGCGGLSQSPLPFTFINGSIPTTPGGVWHIRTVLDIVGVRKSIESVSEGPGRVRVLGAQGVELFRTSFTPQQTDHEETPSRGFTVEVPTFPAARRIEILWNGELRAALDRTPNAPETTIDGPAEGDTALETLEVSWESQDADGDELTTIVRYSHDGGSRFVPLAVQPERSELSIPTASLPSSRDGVLQVIVSDGLNTTVTEVGGLRVGRNKPPRTRIHRSGQSGLLREGANVVLAARVDDAEDEAIAPDAVAWVSDIDGPLGTGFFVNTSRLARGHHTITLRAQDSEGSESTDTISLAIVAASDEPDFTRGDANADGSFDISDGLKILNFLFRGGSEPPCRDAGDTDDSGVMDVSDAANIFNFLFREGRVPPVPGPWVCGSDPTEDELGCDAFPTCPR